jgi:hypothetical protein
MFCNDIENIVNSYEVSQVSLLDLNQDQRPVFCFQLMQE